MAASHGEKKISHGRSSHGRKKLDRSVVAFFWIMRSVGTSALLLGHKYFLIMRTSGESLEFNWFVTTPYYDPCCLIFLG